MTSVVVQRLEFQDFKSYAGKVSIGPFTNFTCIVGPNGSGKSNVLDGLSFVLAGSVSRGGDVRDLINKTARQNKKNQAECSVTMVLLVGGTREVTFTRTAKASTGGTETRVDGHVVTEREFGVALRKQRIGSRVSNFLVFQHEVEAVAHKKSRELTELLEQVSGSGELKAEYNQKKRAYDAITEQLTAASLEKRSAAGEMQQLKLQKKEADKYEELQGKLAVERRDLALAELFHLEAQLRVRVKQLDEQQGKVAVMQTKVATEEELRKGKKAYADQHKAYLDLVKQNREATLELREKKSVLERIKAAVEHHTKKAARQRDELAAATNNTASRSKQVKLLEEQRDQQKALLAALEAQWKKEDAEAAKSNTLTPEQVKEYKALKADVDVQTVTLRQQADTVRRQRDALNVALKQVQIAVDATEGGQRDSQGALERNGAAERQLHAKLEELLAQEKQLAAQVESSRVVLHQMQSRNAERDRELSELDAQLSELKFVKDDTRHSQKVTDAMQALTSMFPGRVHGRMVDLCEIPAQKYRNAVTVAFGKFLDGVVVDTTETAMACVRYLKEQRVASMSFIPLNSAQGNQVTDSLRALGGTTRPAVDLIKFDALIEPAVRFAVGDTLVCDTVTEARRVAYGGGTDGERRKVVTVDGTVLLKNGAVQGGLAATQSRARKWDEKLYDKLKEAREQLLRSGSGDTTEADVARAQFDAKDQQSNLDFTRVRIGNTRKELDALKAKMEHTKKAAAAAAEQLVGLKQRQAQHVEQVQKLEQQMQELQNQVSVLENTAFAALQKKTGIKNLAEMEQREAVQARQRAEKRQSLLVTINRLERSVDTESKRGGGTAVKEIQASLDKTDKEARNAAADLQKYQGFVEERQKKQEAVQKQVDAAKAKLDETEAQNRRNSKTTDAEVRELAQIRKAVTMLQTNCEALRQQRAAVAQRCRVEQIDLPLTTDQIDDAAAAGGGAGAGAGGGKKGARRGRETEADPADVNLPLHQMRFSESFSMMTSSGDDSMSPANAAAGKKRGAAAAALKERKDSADVPVRVDFSSLSTEVRKELTKKEAFAAVHKRAEAAIDQLLRDIDVIARPNLKAARNLDATEQKLGTSTAAVEGMRAKQKKALEDFSAIKELRFQRFMSMFEKLQEHVDGVYRQLTIGTRTADVHGSAYLTLEDTDEPYNGGTQYHATPPMKRFMTMEALSGGERTMAALALLFSIHCASPTPFFVLDEVDAALDIGNVANLAQYMRTRCGQCQFLVVSLKEQLYHVADSLIGVFKDVERETSAILTLDVSQMQRNNNNAAAATATAVKQK